MIWEKVWLKGRSCAKGWKQQKNSEIREIRAKKQRVHIWWSRKKSDFGLFATDNLLKSLSANSGFLTFYECIIFDEPHYSHGGINYANSPNQRKLNMNKDIYLKQIRGTGSVE